MAVHLSKWSQSVLMMLWIILVLSASVSQTAHSRYADSNSEQIHRTHVGTSSDLPTADDLKNIMPFEPVQYSEPRVNHSYLSNPKFDPRGMGHLYLITNLFMDQIQREEPVPPELLRVKNDTLEFRVTDWPIVARHYAGVIAVSLAGLLFAMMLPCVGLIMCCCRCAGKCGSRSQPFDKKQDPCKRVSYGILLSCVTIIILFGVVCAFVTNEYLQNGTRELPRNLKRGVHDTRLYLANTKKEVNNLLVKNYQELEVALADILDESGHIVKNRLAEVSKAVAIENLTAVVAGLGKIKEDLQGINRLTGDLQSLSQQLRLGLEQVRKNLVTLLRNCTSSECQNILTQYKIERLSVEANFHQLPDVTNSLHEVSILINNNIEKEVMNGKLAFDNIQAEIQEAVNVTVPQIKRQIKHAGREMQESAKNITEIVDKVDSVLQNNTGDRISEGEKYIKEYAKYRYYIGLGACIGLLVILVCLVFGLFYGVCGKRPDGTYGDDCCNKGNGARMLMCGVFFIFLLSSVLMVITVAHFLIGIMAEKTVCEPLQHPNGNQLMEFVSDMVHLDRAFPTNAKVNVNISSVIRSCHRNGSVYNVLDLEHVASLSGVRNYRRRFGIDAHVEELRKRIRLDKDVVILTRPAREQLQKLANSKVSDINFTSYTVILEEKITSINLIDLAGNLNRTADRLSSHEDNIANRLRNEALFLEGQQRIVSSMLGMVGQLKRNTSSLQEDLKFNHTSLRVAIRELIRQIQDAQNYLQTHGKDEVLQLANTFASEFTRHIDEYTSHVDNQVRTQVGKCWPVSQVYNATVIAVCNEVIDPFNGFWLSIGWCVILFIPGIVLCILLSVLYQKTDPYPGPLVESEYLYDAYADRDNIPLANVHEKKAHRGYTESYENQSGYVPERGAQIGSEGEVVVRNDGGNDSRFRDMAPTHWDYPNGGPPRYSSTPLATEYERPPPYYYPGPGDIK